MQVSQEFVITDEARAALEPAIRKSNVDWPTLRECIANGSACVWNIGGTGWALTVANTDAELEVVLAGGRNARECVKHWEAAVTAHPAHKGLTLRADGRRGWKRLLKHWRDDDGILTLKIGA